MLDETKIQYLLYQELIARGHEIIVPNVSWSWLYWEADIISITKAGYMNEYEIKISKQDFKADFKKRKHNSFKRCSFREGARVPNRFWYVAPIKAIPICVPDYAGIMLVYEMERGKFKDLRLQIIKQAPLIHKNKVGQEGKNSILRSIMFKYWNLAQILNTNKIQRELFN